MKLISGVFHPLLMLSYICLLVYSLEPSLYSPIPNDYILRFIGIIFITTFIIPSVSILFLKLTNTISSLELLNRRERSIPFLFVGCFYGISTYMLHYKLNMSVSITAMMTITTFLIIILSLISLKNKISIHAAAVWGVCGIVSAIGFNYPSEYIMHVIVLVFLTAGVTSSSRLYLSRHTPPQVWQGALLGFFVCFIGTYLFV